MSRSKSTSHTSASKAGSRGDAARLEESSPNRSKARYAPAAMQHTPIDLAALDTLRGDSLGLFCWSDVRPLAGVAGYVDWRLCGALSQALQSNNFGGDADETLLLPVTGRFGPRRLFIFGLGSAAQWDGTVLHAACRRAYEVMHKAGTQSIILAAPARRGDLSMEAAFVKAARDELVNQIDQVLTERV